MTIHADALRMTQADRLAALEPVLEQLRERREEFQTQRYVSRDFIDALKPAGVYRASTPARFGGDPLHPADFLDIVERISRVDGSTGWVASFGSALVYLAALPLETQAELYAEGPDVVFAGGLFPVQPAAPTDNGFLVNGRWKFASGCMGADILGVGLPGDAASDNKPRTALLRPESAEIIQEWDVSGMRGTGSFDIVVRDVEVLREWTFIRGGASTVDEPLYRYPAIAYAAQVLAIVGAGVARAALDFAESQGSGATGVTGAPKLGDRAYFRTGFAGATAALESARSWFYDVTKGAWETVLAGDPVSDAQNARLRLASSNLASVSAKVVNDVSHITGTGSIYTRHPLHRLGADAFVPQQHAFLGPSMLDAAGSVLLGSAPTVPGFR
ncbi:acyl-CoA dehydrogenase family protein [Microbacterium sp. LMC-P-041]|uniref:acyl-CoA dehydrogenase family protein n=1 Tax=Microbacterium sp. LMC-P-041 TaxID=3040293 RepID=UPI0025523732|nr:acyl-CoA dehydrogenase family protein [Microbacterium sp. LMC-P-041]